MKKVRKRHALVAVSIGVVLAALLAPALGVGSGSKSLGLPTKIGPGEGALTMIGWEGYLDKSWVNPFVKQTGCKITYKYAGSSDEMVTLMTRGGGGQYDMVSASGDASLRLIYGGYIAPTNVKLVKPWKDFYPPFKSPPNNTVKGVHYGISLQFGPNILAYNPKVIKKKPTSWAAIYDPKYKGKITIPDNAIQIADAALYLSKTQPGLGIKDPYELNPKQFAATVALLKKQAPLIKKRWLYASDEAQLFRNGDVAIGAAWPQLVSILKGAKQPIASLTPKEGATAWLDTWMLSSKAKHPNCAYLWWNYISTPQVQAKQGVFWPETPVNRKACPYMDKIQPGSCHTYHADEPVAYYRTLKVWKTPVADCGNGQKDCADYNKWLKAWTAIKG
jgi:putative spermidine/putrescine transport system substrate-binding protein